MAGSRQYCYYSAKHKSKGRKFCLKYTNKTKNSRKIYGNQKMKIETATLCQSAHKRQALFYREKEGEGLASSSGVEDKSKGLHYP